MPSRLPRMWGKRADSSDVGLADFASFYCILVPIKKLCVDRHPSPLRSPAPPWAPALRPRSAEGVSGPAHPNPAPPKAPPGRRPPRASPAPAPPLRPHPTAAASGSSSQKQQRQRRQLRALPLPGPRGRDSDPPLSVPRGAAGSDAPSTREASRGRPSARPAPPHLSVLGATRALLPPRPPGCL